jgi:hypothetical protein
MMKNHLGKGIRSACGVAGVLAVGFAAVACNPQPEMPAETITPPAAAVHTVIHTLEVTRIVEVPVTVTPRPTSAESPTGTETASSNPTETPTRTETATPSSTPTYSAPRIRVLMWSQCRYGPGVGYLYEYDLFEDNLMEVIGWQEILAQKKEGVWEPSIWLYVRALGGVNICWVNSNLVRVYQGDIFDAPRFTARMPFSELYKPPRAVEAWREGNNVTVMWSSVWMTEDDYRGYLVEAWVCHGGQLYLAPVGYTGVNIANPAVIIPDEPGCSEPSNARLYTVEKHGYTQWIRVPWPAFEEPGKTPPA